VTNLPLHRDEAAMLEKEQGTRREGIRPAQPTTQDPQHADWASSTYRLGTPGQTQKPYARANWAAVHSCHTRRLAFDLSF
jgi:hypothetical protein